ncbi:MAG: class I SAM-dependent methyltransferase [Candidatus Diapherotrites archaeon]
MLGGTGDKQYFSWGKSEDYEVPAWENPGITATEFFRYPVHDAFLAQNRDKIGSFADLSSGIGAGASSTIEAKAILGENVRVLATDVARNEGGVAILERNGIEFRVHSISEGPLDEKVDVIRLANVAQWMKASEMERALDNCWASLNEGGILMGAMVSESVQPFIPSKPLGEEEFILIKTKDGWAQLVYPPLGMTPPLVISYLWTNSFKTMPDFSDFKKNPLNILREYSDKIQVLLISKPDYRLEVKTENPALPQEYINRLANATVDIHNLVLDETDPAEVTTFDNIKSVTDVLISQVEAEFEIKLDPALQGKLDTINSEGRP